MSSLTPAAGIPDPITRAINPGVREDIRDLIDQAAKSQGRSRSDFMIDTARRAAEEALLDQALLRVGPEAFASFQARLDAPPEPNERLRRTMQAVPPWDKA
jgi:uncharacterized protein (DUF1778 family)